MKNQNLNLHDHFFSYTLVLLIILISIASFYRFMVRHDYIVGYEGVCDPATKKCFVGVDDTSGKEYYYSKVQKYEPDLYLECGKDITDCKAAILCLPTDRECSVIYCNSEIAGDICTALTEKLNVQSNYQVEPSKEGLLQSNNTNNTNI